MHDKEYWSLLLFSWGCIRLQHLLHA